MTEALHLNQFKLEFTDRVQMLLQEQGSKLRSFVETGSYSGSESASPVNQVAPVDASSPAGRNADLLLTNINHERRWVDPQDFELATTLDKFDALRYSPEYIGPYARAHAIAMGRAIDDTIIAAATGTAKIGKRGAGSEAFDTTNFRVAATVGAGASTGLNVSKLIEATEIFQDNNVDLDMEPPTLVVTPKQHSNLLNQIEIASMDFNVKPVLVDGRVKEFMGFNIVVSNRKQTGDVPFGFSSGSVRRCFAFVRSGIHLGIWKDVASRVDERKDKSSIPWQVHSSMTIGATRTEQGKVIEILCDEA